MRIDLACVWVAALLAGLGCAGAPAPELLADGRVPYVQGRKAFDEGKLGLADERFREARVLAEEWSGARSLPVLHVVEMLAYTNQNLGRPAEAERFHRLVLSMVDDVVPEDLIRRAVARGNLASILVENGDGAEAEALLVEGRALLPADAPLGHAIMFDVNLASLYKRQVRTPEAATLLVGSIERLLAAPDSDPRHLAIARHTLATVRIEQQRFEEARALCDEALPVLVNTYLVVTETIARWERECAW